MRTEPAHLLLLLLAEMAGLREQLGASRARCAAHRRDNDDLQRGMQKVARLERELAAKERELSEVFGQMQVRIDGPEAEALPAGQRLSQRLCRCLHLAWDGLNESPPHATHLQAVLGKAQGLGAELEVRSCGFCQP